MVLAGVVTDDEINLVAQLEVAASGERQRRQQHQAREQFHQGHRCCTRVLHVAPGCTMLL
jgi:hypothetical protein